MNWMLQLNSTQPVAHAVAVLSLVCCAGMALGTLRFRGAGLGTAGVLFAGIVTGHFGQPVNQGTLDFVKEFGLILFVFAIGLQLGPGFFAALREQGARFNALAAAIVLLGAVGAPIIGRLAHFDAAAIPGLFAGASVNMPALGAATQTLDTLPGISPDHQALPALACAVAFPTAIVSSIVALLLLKRIFRIDPVREAADLAEQRRRRIHSLERRTLVVSNPAIDGLRLAAIPGRHETGVTIARLRRGDDTQVATNATVIRIGDRLAVVGTRAGLDEFARGVGSPSDEDLVLASGPVTFRRVVVTDRDVLGRSVGELDLDERFSVAVTRITRADLEITAVPDLRLKFGDMVQIVGREADLDRAAAALGNSLKELNETHFIPLFFGIYFGVALGTLPIHLPGLPQPVRLGLAGGPLIIALALGRLGHIGRFVCHMPVNANIAFRDFGISLFFAAVGLDAGPKFFATVLSATGLQWMLATIALVLLPLLLVGAFARLAWRMNFTELTGLLAGSTTNPPALTFASNLAGSDAPTVAYATVYPLTMLLRILCAQVLTLTLMR